MAIWPYGDCSSSLYDHMGGHTLIAKLCYKVIYCPIPINPTSPGPGTSAKFLLNINVTIWQIIKIVL